jgi:hypothetical protein
MASAVAATSSFTHHVYGSTRSLLAGAGLCYAIHKREYLHVPLVLIFPSAYAGYQLFNHKDSIADWTLSKLRLYRGFT